MWIWTKLAAEGATHVFADDTHVGRRNVQRDGELFVSNAGVDGNWLTRHGLPTVTLGCGQQDIHTVNETLHIESYLQACRISSAFSHVCGRSHPCTSR